jgi:hypothetical protein
MLSTWGFPFSFSPNRFGISGSANPLDKVSGEAYYAKHPREPGDEAYDIQIPSA